jgi:sulfur carrier protein ThiS
VFGLFIWAGRVSLAEVNNMDKKTLFNVEVADQSGHSVVQMNQDEIASKAASDNSAWVFVNDQLVSAADIADMNLEEGSRIRMMPGLVGGNDAPTFVVQTADSTGHSEVVMTQAEIASKATSDNSAWVFVNDQLVSAADIADMNLEEGSRIRMMPGLVGGLYC